MADGRAVVVGLTVVPVHPRRIGAVRAGAHRVHVREHAFEVGAVVLDVVDHPRRSTGVADQRVHRAQQRDVDGPDGTHRLNSVGQAGVEHRDESGPAVAGGVPVAVELDEDDVGLVDAALRMLVTVVRHLDRDRGMTRLALVLQQLAGEWPARPSVHRGGRAGPRAGHGAATVGGGAVALGAVDGWLRLGTGGKPGTNHSQQGRAAADPQHVKSSVRRSRVL